LLPARPLMLTFVKVADPLVGWFAIIAALYFLIQPYIDTRAGMATCSTTLRTTNQYRLYFNDNTALVVGFTGEKISGILPLNYGIPVRCICSTPLSTGTEVTYFGSDDGYVYQDSIGTSFDGDAIEAWIRPVFNNLGSPRVRKQSGQTSCRRTCPASKQAVPSWLPQSSDHLRAPLQSH